MTRVQCLYRVSTEGQLYATDTGQSDIPMQRLACHKFAAERGWKIIFEDQEEGVSGHKVRAEHRGVIQRIRERAKFGQFDVLLVFLFDRLGRISDETPFVVEWFVQHGIQVWSVMEGQQTFDSHVDKLINYIRFWQADGESEKISIRTATRMRQMVEAGQFTGGTCPYGYQLVKKGRVNRRGQEVHDLEIMEDQAQVVQAIYDKYVNWGMGAHTICTWLHQNGFIAPSGKSWHEATVRNILCNLTYTGVLRSNDIRSPVQPHLVIIEKDVFHMAQKIRKERREHGTTLPRYTRNQVLANGLLVCGHCGSSMVLTTHRRYRKRKDGTQDDAVRIRYTCYGKTRKQTNCDGQTGYDAIRVDEILEKAIGDLLRNVTTTSKQSLFEKHMAGKQKICYIKHQLAKGELIDIQQKLEVLKQEIVKSLQGESSFSPEMLQEQIDHWQKIQMEKQEICLQTQWCLYSQEAIAKQARQELEQFAQWNLLWETGEFGKRKRLLQKFIEKVEIQRDYHIKIQFSEVVEQIINILKNGGTT